MNNILQVYVVANVVVILLLCIYKTAYFFKYTAKRNLRRWFYFNKYSIINAPTPYLQKLRVRQNNLTNTLLSLIILLIILSVYYRIVE